MNDAYINSDPLTGKADAYINSDPLTNFVIYTFTCTECVGGSYKVGVRDGPCVACPANTILPAGSTNATDCQCNAGFSGPAAHWRTVRV